MATIKSGLNIFVYNGPEADLNAVPWLPNARALYQINSDRTGWESFKYLRPYPAFEALTVNAFYLIDAYRDFALPDAQTYACATGEASGVIPDGLSLFVYSGADLALNGASFSSSVAAIYQVNDLNNGWDSFKPDRPYPAFETLVSGTFYFIQANSPFTLAGAQVIGCLETFGDETLNGSLYVKYTDLKGDTLNPTVKTAPNMVLFAALKAAFDTHNHDTRYYQKFETYTKAEIDLFLQGVQEVQEYANLAAFPPTGLSNVLYIDAQYNVGYRWNGTGYTPISSPGVDLSPYLKIADAEATYLKKTDAVNTYQIKGNYLTQATADPLYQAKGNYVKSISLPTGLNFTPNLAGNITLLLDAYFDYWMKARPGYDVTKNDQTIGHDTNGVILWKAGGTVANPVEGDFDPADFTNDFYLTTV